MTDSTENLILEHLKRFQADLGAARERDLEMLARLGPLEVAIAGLRRDNSALRPRRRRAELTLGSPG